MNYLFIKTSLAERTSYGKTMIHSFKRLSGIFPPTVLFLDNLLTVFLTNSSVTSLNANFLLKENFWFNLTMLGWDKNLLIIKSISSKMLNFGSPSHSNKSRFARLKIIIENTVRLLSKMLLFSIRRISPSPFACWKNMAFQLNKMFWSYFGRLTLVRQRPMKSHSSVYPFVCLSVSLSLHSSVRH